MPASPGPPPPLLLLLLLAAAATADVPTRRVLFVGNSLTYANDLPGVMTRLFASSGSAMRVTVASSVAGGANFRDHCTHVPSLAAIRRAVWDVVVLQDQVTRKDKTPAEKFMN